LSLAIVCTY